MPSVVELSSLMPIMLQTGGRIGDFCSRFPRATLAREGIAMQFPTAARIPYRDLDDKDHCDSIPVFCHEPPQGLIGGMPQTVWFRAQCQLSSL